MTDGRRTDGQRVITIVHLILRLRCTKNLLVLYFNPAQPQGYVMSVKCEVPIVKHTAQVWLLYHHPNFIYCTLLAGQNLYGQTVDLITTCPRRTFQAGGIKTICPGSELIEINFHFLRLLLMSINII